MRRNDYDVTDTVCITDPRSVRDEVVRLFRALYPQADAAPVARVFDDMVALYRGEHPDYLPCDTEYHDLQHVLDVTLAMARLMDGYERARVNGGETLTPDHFLTGLVTALLHDQGYLRRRNDHRHRYGSEYTKTHVSRGAAFLRRYLDAHGLGSLGRAAAQIVHFTGYERPASSIRVADPLLRRMGYLIGTADIIAQTSDRCYLEKCRDRLYPEFVLGGIDRRTLPDGRVEVLFASGDDLVHKTPGFYLNARKRLDEQLERVYRYAERHFGGQNLYIEEMEKNARYAQVVADADHTEMLRRAPPYTLSPGVEPYPKGLVIRAPGRT